MDVTLIILPPRFGSGAFQQPPRDDPRPMSIEAVSLAAGGCLVDVASFEFLECFKDTKRKNF
jgi:hypothetical protein